jgi:ATP-dependent DNA helicase RecG
VNKENLLVLIETGEGFTLEFKEGISSSLGKDICAFANASGGTILIGVNDQGHIVNRSLSNSDRSKIQDIARNMDPSFTVSVQQVEHVAKPYSVNGNFYIRIGANSQKLNRDEIRSFFQKQRLVVFDEKINESFSLEYDFNDDAFNEFIQRSNISNVIPKEDLLKNLGFLKEEKLNNAGVLFFCNDVFRFFLNVNITCVLYQGDSKYKILILNMLSKRKEKNI